VVRVDHWQIRRQGIEMKHAALAESLLDERLSALFSSKPEALPDAPDLFRELREQFPVHEHPAAVLFSSYSDVSTLLRDDANLGKADRYLNATTREALARMGEHERRVYLDLADFEGLQLTATDSTEHRRLRGIMHRAMTPARIAALEQSVHDATYALLEPLLEQELADLMPFAYRLPLIVICDLLGIPEADREMIHTWTSAIGRNKGGIPDADVVAAAHAAMGEFRTYLDEMFDAHRHTRTRSGLLAALMDAEGDQLTSEELAANFVMLLLAGHETTTNLIGIGLFELLRHPDQWRALRDAPVRAPSAVEELLRFVTPVQWVVRVPSTDFEHRGVAIPQGQLVFLLLAAANRDPTAFSDAERLDIGRSDETRHLSFGLGPHFCLGTSLARLEGRIAFEALASRYPAMELAADNLRWRGNARLRGLASLPIALGQPCMGHRRAE
jgi:cytochrome P450